MIHRNVPDRYKTATGRRHGRERAAMISSRAKWQGSSGGHMRALRLVLVCPVLLAAGAACAADPVKIRASWIVAPSDWAPLLPEKPELMKNNGKSYVFEPMRFQGTP